MSGAGPAMPPDQNDDIDDDQEKQWYPIVHPKKLVRATHEGSDWDRHRCLSLDARARARLTAHVTPALHLERAGAERYAGGGGP